MTTNETQNSGFDRDEDGVESGKSNDGDAENSSHVPTVEEIKDTYPDYEGQIIHQTEIESEEAQTVPAEEVLPDPIANSLGELYTHQAEAISQLQQGNNVTAATSTSSGKTWIYTLFYAAKRLANSNAKALLLYPTKALSADQERAISELIDEVGVDATVDAYDGDTDSGEKPRIRSESDVIISNFSAINHYLNDHTKWGSFFSNVELVVVDESHTYTGIQGMHVIWVLRRLRRVLNYYDSHPQYVCSTATIGNPKEHSEALVGVDFNVVDNDGSPRGKRKIAFWQPPIVDTDDDGMDVQRKRVVTELAHVSTHLARLDTQTLGFLRSRQNCEMANKKAESNAKDDALSSVSDVYPYHAGLPKYRRQEIEAALDSGDADAVFSTSALELGIDIGSVDATTIGGYPGTRQSFWQQVGRAGRGTSDSLSLFLPRDRDAIDQYIVSTPSYLLEDDVEDAVVSVENNTVYAKHILCAANELPLKPEDADILGGEQRLRDAVSVWQDAGKIRGDLNQGAQYVGPPRPQSNISMYGTTDTQFHVECVEDNTTPERVDGDPQIDIEPVQRERAYRDFHEGALFMHDGEQFEVLEMDEEGYHNLIKVRKVDTPFYTVTEHDKRIHDVVSNESIQITDDIAIHAGMGVVDITYSQYRKVPIYETDSEQETHPQPLNLPPISIQTQLMWVELPEGFSQPVIESLDEDVFQTPPDDGMLTDEQQWTFDGGLHGAEHGMIKLAPLELRIDNSDIGGLSTSNHPELDGPTWFIHDGVEGGVGFSHSIYDNFIDIAERTRERVADCDCESKDGCPACLVSSQCGNRNEPLSKAATIEILDRVISD